MTETAPTRRTRLTDVPSAYADERESGFGYVWRYWAVVVLFAAVAAERSAALGIGVRDPEGQMFRNRLAKALVFLVVIALVEAVVRARRRGWSLRHVGAVLRERWTGQRLVLVLTGLVGYHVVYLCYRNLKSWNAFNQLRDDDLLAFDKALFLGHHPAALLHTLVGEEYAAEALAVVYRSFTYVIVLALVGSLALIPRVRRAYVFLSAATWAWILGTFAYYVLPSLGPYAAAPAEFAGLRPTPITETQAEYLTERAAFLADPSMPDAFVSLGAFASLHVGFTTLVLLMARYYGLRRTTRVLAVYLALIIVSTIYFGWHYVTDDIAGRPHRADGGAAGQVDGLPAALPVAVPQGADVTVVDDAPSDAAALAGPATYATRVLQWSPVLVATVLAGVLHLLWWRLLATPGGDIAAQDAWAAFARAHPGSAYDLAWYGGMHPVSYSAISPYLMAVLGVRPTMVVVGTLSAGLLALLLERSPHVRHPMLPAVFGALALTGNAVSGRVTFGLGLLFGLAALVAAFAWPARLRLRVPVIVALAALTTAASAVAGLLLGLVAAALWLTGERRLAYAHRAAAAGRGGGVRVAVPAVRRAADVLVLRPAADRGRAVRGAAVPPRLAAAADARGGLPRGRPDGVADALPRRHEHQPPRPDLRRRRPGRDPARPRLGALAGGRPTGAHGGRGDAGRRPDHVGLVAGRAGGPRRHQHRTPGVAEPRPPAARRPAPGPGRRPGAGRGRADGQPP